MVFLWIVAIFYYYKYFKQFDNIIVVKHLEKSANQTYLLNWLVNGDKFVVFINKSKEKSDIELRVVLFDKSEKIIAKPSDSPNIHFVDVKDNKIVWEAGISVGRKVMEFDLVSKQTIETEYSSGEEWDAQIHIKKTGEFYQCYKEDKLLFEERFAACRLDDGVI